ncbi:MAG: ATP-binding protein [Methylobacillus glycogenes]|nr:ATP-binding protein [Methylobacillus glycogenes]
MSGKGMSKPVSTASILRIAILGAEATGKSTLAAALAAHYHTLWVPEYLREFVETSQRPPVAAEQLLIATTQLQREAESAKRVLEQTSRLLFCDTTPLMTAIYSEHYFVEADSALARLAAAHDYAATIVTAPSMPWVADGMQRDSDAVRQKVHQTLLHKLQQAGIQYQLVDGSLQQRVLQSVKYLGVLLAQTD